MRRIGTLIDEQQAHRLASVLRAEGIETDLEPDKGGTDIWVHDDARLDDARAVLDAFVAAPNDPRWMDAAREGDARARARQVDDAQWRQRVAAARVSINGADGRGFVTLGLVIVSLGVAALTGLGGDMQAVAPLMLSTLPAGRGLPQVASGEVWRLFTPIFVHYGVLHLLFNTSNLWTWGGAIEARKGGATFALLCATAALASNLGEHAWAMLTSPGAVHFVGGLSGVLYAVFGYAWAKGRIDPADAIGLPESVVSWMMGWLFLCMTGMLGPVANAAHVSGLVFGGLFAWLEVRWFHWRKGRG